MAEKPEPKMPLIVGWGDGPQIYAGEVVSVMFDGAAINMTFGNLEARIARKDDAPTEPPVVTVCGKISLSPNAAIQTVNILSKILGAIQAGKPEGTFRQPIN